MIYKSAVTEKFVIVPNSLANDSYLSFAARGMLIYILSRPVNWEIKLADLQKVGDCGRDKIYSLINELLESKYLVRRQANETGGFKKVSYDAFSEPQENRVLTDLTDTGFTDTPNTDAYKEKKVQRKESTKDTSRIIDYEENGMSEGVNELDEDDFGLWWYAYPRQYKRASAKMAYFAARRKTDAVTLLKAAEIYAQENYGVEKKFIKAPENWLREMLWEDNAPPPMNLYEINGQEIRMTAEEAVGQINAKLIREK